MPEAGAPGVSLNVVRLRILSAPTFGALGGCVPKGRSGYFIQRFVERQERVLFMFLFR